jgi:hypothetical protein
MLGNAAGDHLLRFFYHRQKVRDNASASGAQQSVQDTFACSPGRITPSRMAFFMPGSYRIGTCLAGYLRAASRWHPG